MNLPLQVRAVARGRFAKSRAVGMPGQVVPSFTFVCNPPNVACVCGNKTGCCGPLQPCNCDGSGNPVCGQSGGPGTTPGNQHWRAEGDCNLLGGFAIHCFKQDPNDPNNILGGIE